ncbi:fimbrial protein [Providencia vermicola]|uniref:fimbrial protein n=1 Tax=Providencia vermicola TaxID=333965 RepID=UPI0032DB863B
MMKKTLLALLLPALLLASYDVAASCSNAGEKNSPPLNFDISTELTSTSTTVNKSTRTGFTGQYTCVAPGLLQSNTVGIDSPFRQSTVAIGFNGGKQVVSISVSGISQSSVTNIPPGTYPASNLDTNFTIQFKLLSSPPANNYKEVAGNSVLISPVMMATDVTALGLIPWLLRLLSDLVTFLLTLQWPTHAEDMFYQPMQLTYNPILTTCNFTNQGLVVSLPPVSINTVKNVTRAGYTPFTLNFTCQDFLAGSTASRDVSMFLSSGSLLANDKTTINNTLTQGAKGVGFRLVKTDNLTAPLFLSDSVTAQNTATSIFFVPKGNPISPSFSVNLGAYYYPYNPNIVTQGAVSGTATVVMSYN